MIIVIHCKIARLPKVSHVEEAIANPQGQYFIYREWSPGVWDTVRAQSIFGRIREDLEFDLVFYASFWNMSADLRLSFMVLQVARCEQGGVKTSARTSTLVSGIGFRDPPLCLAGYKGISHTYSYTTRIFRKTFQYWYEKYEESKFRIILVDKYWSLYRSGD